MDMNSAVGKVVRRLRHDQGMSLFDLSRRTDFAVMQNVISSLERGKTRWTFDHMMPIARALDIEIETLVRMGLSEAGPKE